MKTGPGASIEHSFDTGLARLLKEFAPRGFTSEACAVRVGAALGAGRF